jgi:hypothetical protein
MTPREQKSRGISLALNVEEWAVYAFGEKDRICIANVVFNTTNIPQKWRLSFSVTQGNEINATGVKYTEMMLQTTKN